MGNYCQEMGGSNVHNDLCWEHFQHNTYEKDCSECYSEARLLRAKRIVGKTELGTNIRRGVEEDIERNPNPLE